MDSPAAREALDRGLWEEASAAFRASLARGETPAALEGLGRALYWLDRVEESLEARERAFCLYREAGATRDAARVATELGVDCLDLRGEAPALGWLERARRLLEGLPPGPEHGWLALWQGHLALAMRRDTPAALQLAASALALGRSLGLADLELLARALEGLTIVAEGRVEEGMSRLDEATAAALGGEMNALASIGATCCYLVHACERVRDYDRAAQWAARLSGFSQRWGIAPALAVCLTQQAAMLIGRGEWAAAERELATAAARLAASRPLLVPEAHEQLAELRRRQGRWDEAERLFASVEGRSLALLGRAVIAWDRGEAEGAADLLDRFLRRTPPDNWSGRAAALELLARVERSRGRNAEAGAALEQLLDLARRVETPTIRASALVAQGLASAAAERHDESRRQLEDAVDLLVKSRAPYELARARVDLGASLAAAGRIPDARRELSAALQGFRELGAERDVRSAEARLSALLEPATAAPPSDLTARELEVLRLVASGLGDKEIASRLGLSGHTVHRHISNVRTKLGLPSRAAAVAWAARSGVL